jgi:sporulation protein YqfC
MTEEHIYKQEDINMRKKKRCAENKYSDILDSISRGLDLPQDAVSGYAHIEISGNREVIVDGCQGVIEYGDTAIVLNTGRLNLRVCGCDLTIVSMLNSQTVIRGRITGVDYC